MADVVLVFFVEFVVGFFGEAGAPETDTFVETEADAFEEKSVLQAAKVFEVGVTAEGDV